MEQHRNDIDLSINGRMFPTWIMTNFKKYKLDQIFAGKDDPCSGKTVEGFRKYQVFVSRFLDYRSPFKDILIYHGLGSGKTATSINVYNILYNYNPGWNVFILIKAGLHKGWDDEIETWMSKDDLEYRKKNLIFVHYDSPFADKAFIEAVRNADSSKKNIYIIDECHNFIGNVYSNISTNKGKRAQEIYDYIVQDKKENDTTRVILISGTPAVKNPFELALLFNLLRPNTFPKSESLFNQYFVNQTTGEMNSAYKNMFQRRILGLVSYYIGATPDAYATQTTYEIEIPMSEYQISIYKHFESIEAKAMQKSKGKSESYRTYTRQACNFVFPYISQDVTGEQRPRPSRFRLSEREAEKIAEGKLGTKFKVDPSDLENVQGYLNAIENYVQTFDDYLNKFNKKDIENGYTLQDDIKHYLETYKKDYNDFFNKHKKKSEVFNAMYKSSPKMTQMLFICMTSRGSIMIYSNYVIMEGLQLIKVYLKYFGFTQYGKEAGKDKFRFIEYSGNIDKNIREENRSLFNDPKNKYGDNIRVFLLSPAASEGLTLKNVRQVHILEPYWHETRIIQTIGRAIRMCVHKDLPPEERHVDVYRYKSISPNIVTADQYVEGKAKLREKLIVSFLDALKEASVDCQLNYAHNSLKNPIKCFQFDEPSLFAKQIGPAYKKDILDDVNMNNGSNSLTSTTMKIKVVKIMAVKQLKDNKYTSVEKYWYSPERGVVYDYDLHFPYGKISKDENGIPRKLDKDVYIIDQIIPIPILH